MDDKIEVDAGAAGRWRAAFMHSGDRYGHQIGIVTRDEFRPLIGSGEGDASQAWPASPPLQQLHIESRGAQRDVALLVGMAGRSHWSLSVESVESALVFDVACRSSVEPEMLGSRYTALTGDWRKDDGGSATLLLSDGGALRIESLTPNLALEVGPRDLALIVMPENAGKQAVVAGNPAAAATWRWRYRVMLEA